ncbi:MAG: type 11 methyltransferase [Candidatus Berkelbacteria bacterium Licking1014_96]|uniref:Type 11 methyltransferase n=1 Tax=Candidatus Berkelbacteria bacterium Licking1014_96 TaxID=2017149 RepID=A0A554LH57_9BACT|nr:MAG: type 11 methyltransferase [Candidatus Berkelbacteria bacterium Licking1014_96]
MIEKLKLNSRGKWVAGYYNKKALGENNGDEINRLLGQKLNYPVYHHFGIGVVKNIDYILKRLNPEEIKRKLYDLEKAESQHLVRLLSGRINQNSLIFDAGSGLGGTAFDLNEKYGCSVYGANIAEKQVKLANNLAVQRGIKDKVKFFLMNITRTNFKEEKFDVAINNETTMYVSLDKLFSELSRILKNGGIYGIVTWCRADKYLANNHYADKIDSHYHTKMHSLGAYKKSLSAHNFKIIQINDLTKKALDYWILRKYLSIATGVEQFFIDGYKKRKLKYISILAMKQSLL